MSGDNVSDDDSIDINLRSASEVGARMVVLAAIIRRAAIEMPLDEDEENEDEELDTPEGERFDLITALTSGPLAGASTAGERAFVTAPLGSIGERDALEASWQVEALAALAAASIPRHAMPEPWKQVDPGPLLAAIPEPWDDLNAFVASLALFDEESIAFERERAELWLWRTAIDDDVRMSSGRDRDELLTILRDAVQEAADAKLIETAGRDFRVGKARFAEVDPETKAVIAEIARQRLHALNWLCGFGQDWDTVPLDL